MVKPDDDIRVVSVLNRAWSPDDLVGIILVLMPYPPHLEKPIQAEDHQDKQRSLPFPTG
jgi:hypothetical protein